MGDDLQDGDVALAVLREARQMLGHRVGETDQTTLGELP